jgi:putative transposase
VRRQCELLGLNRATLYYEPAGESAENLHLMRLLDEQYLRTPFYGWPRMTAHLRRQGYRVNHKRVRRLMQKMDLQAIYPKPKTTRAAQERKAYPYLLRGLEISRPNFVWSADITYVPMRQGFMYLVAVIDWYSRYVLAWQLSNTLDGCFCLDVLQQALAAGRPHIFNTDQGVQFTAHEFTGCLELADIRISMDGRGRALDNIFVERLWRSVKVVP